MSNPLEQLKSAAADATKKFGVAPATDARLEDALAGTIDPQKLIDNCAEAWRVSADQAQSLLMAHGLGTILARLKPATGTTTNEIAGPPLAAADSLSLADGHIRIRALSPAFNEPIHANKAILDSIHSGITAFTAQAKHDPLGVLYRDHPSDYANRWLQEIAPQIKAYCAKHFPNSSLKYIINSGIGANEQFNYFVARLANARPGSHPQWLLANSPKELTDLPADATTTNTLFLEFSRSGITEETIKLHEFTPPDAKRIVFANTGPLRALAERDGNLLLTLPDEVSGRYGRNKTPILMAPMYVAGMDVAAYWKTIQSACDTMDLTDRASAPVVIAQWLRVQQLRRSANHIYLGTNSAAIRCSADEFCQFWNEGVNRDGNDITMSRYLGLPRDSHMNLEAILGTSEHKLAIFLLDTRNVAQVSNLCDSPAMRASGVAPTSPVAPVSNRCNLLTAITPINPAHANLTLPEVDLVLALANVKRCSEKMPTLLITVNTADLTASAWLGQLWADITLVYSRLIGADPGSNPEVKTVRTRAAEWLTNKQMAFELMP